MGADSGCGEELRVSDWRRWFGIAPAVETREPAEFALTCRLDDGQVSSMRVEEGRARARQNFAQCLPDLLRQEIQWGVSILVFCMQGSAGFYQCLDEGSGVRHMKRYGGRAHTSPGRPAARSADPAPDIGARHAMVPTLRDMS